MSRWLALAVIFGFCTVFGLLESVYRINNDVAYGARPDVLATIYSELTATYSSGLLWLILLPFVRRHRFRRNGWMRTLPWHVAALFAYSLAHTYLMWAARAPIFPLLGLGRYNYGLIPARVVMEFSADVVAYAFFVASVHGFWLYTESRERLLDNLRLQLQPHFLFNSLNMISSMVYEDPRRADEMISKLSELLRRTLKLTSRTVPLSEEMETLDLYLDMVQARYEERLEIDIEIDPNALPVHVPTLLLQPLVENSLKYGFDPETHAVSIHIRAIRRNGRLQIRVTDEGRAAGGEGQGIGLANTAHRLEQLYGARHRFETSGGNGFHCLIEIPCGR